MYLLFHRKMKNNLLTPFECIFIFLKRGSAVTYEYASCQTISIWPMDKTYAHMGLQLLLKYNKKHIRTKWELITVSFNEAECLSNYIIGIHTHVHFIRNSSTPVHSIMWQQSNAKKQELQLMFTSTLNVQVYWCS